MNEDSIKKFQSTFEYKLIYIFRINDKAHEGCLKIGDATVHTERDWNELSPNSHDLNASAGNRIDEYTSTAGITYDLLYTEIAVYVDHCNGKLKSFRDHKVHDVLIRSGIKRKFFDTQKKQNEWFVTDLETAKKAIQAVKDGKAALDSSSITKDKNPIAFRPEQEQAIKETLKCFKTGNKMLWNAKMRFGKTLCALQVAKEEGFKSTIILTHRPVVSDGWYEDFGKIFYDKPDYEFASKTKGKTISELEKEGKNFVYFASIQDLRGASAVGGKFNKDNEIYDHDWDFVVVDEAHEGTQTDLGKKVINQVISGKTKKAKLLELSGTPFNLLDHYESGDIYTWDYIMEQEAKQEFSLNHFGDSNPYEDLPKLNIYTYHLEKSFVAYQDIDDKAFNFKEFFRVWTGDNKKDTKPVPEGAKIGDFVHEDDIVKFLNLILQKSETTNYPFSTEEYRKLFRNTLWVVPGVKEAKALSTLLQNHPVFGAFKIVNVAGDGDEEINPADALTAVRNAFKENEYTITLSCGRLTTGVSVPEWTAVLMLAGSYSTSASQYLQTIFRVQTPANIDGKTKENCYVFDFAPDRTLKMVAESVQLSAKAGKKEARAELTLKKFLNFCPVVSIDETRMKEFKVDQLLQALKKAYVEKVAKNGFDDNKLYNDELLKLDGLELAEFQKLKQIIGASNQQKKAGDIDINNEGFTEEEYETEEKIKEKKSRGESLTEEEKEKIKQLKEKKKNRDIAISILRGISIRIPLLVYGIDMDINSDITIDTFSDPKIIDDLSWNEFMPKGVTREMFRKFSKYYDKDIFIGACRRIRAVSKNADNLEPTERVEKIAELFSTFKNPDKETVLTPWRVVNLHMGVTLGGYSFYDNKFENAISVPRLIDQKGITSQVFNKESNILEINSKTGLYPLYVSYTLYRQRLNEIPEEQQTFENKQKIWDDVVQNQVFVVCKTPMAKQITKRTLVGYRNARVNTRYFEDLINQLEDSRKQESFIRKIRQGKTYWNNKEDDNMKFNAVVGNPPYQEDRAKHVSLTNGQSRSKSVFQYFQLVAEKVSSEYTSLIYPGIRWIHRSGKGMEEFGLNQINDIHLMQLDFYPNATDIFQQVAIADGISIVLKDMKKTESGFTYNYHENNECLTVQMKNPGTELMPINPANGTIVQKVNDFVVSHNLKFISDRILSQKLFGVESSFVQDNPGIARKYDPEEAIDFSSDIKLFANDKAGKAGRTQWFVIPRSAIKVNQKYIDEWQVVVSSANAGGQKRDNQIEIMDNHTAFGRSRVALGSFKTQLEAQNFFNYMNTYLIKFMFLMTDEALTSLGKKVPDFIDYSSNNKLLNFDENLDNQLAKIFGLTKSEMLYIINMVNSIRKKH